MLRLLAFSGSLRRGSFNTALLHAAIDVAPDTCTIELASIRDVPLYDGDYEVEHGIPEPVRKLKDRFAGADGVLISTPEYNGSVPGVLKNTIDWMSRPSADIARVYKQQPLGLIGATTTMGGTRLSQQALLQPFRNLDVHLWSGTLLYVVQANQAFDAQGKLIDDKVRQLLTKYMAGFVAFVAANRRAKVNESPRTAHS
ncbi:MAG TPA: NADPH-dependent FMN reductase [Steroidobacteraceae bacterium]|nr:NADPH-dependent FMN reductase [Steroidobacteraceae bacterium]